MSSGERRIDQLGNVTFTGDVSANVAAYAKGVQAIARDLAVELEIGANVAEQAMRRLNGHPRLAGVNVRFRARLVTRRLRRAHHLALEVSAEAVRFNAQYRREFLQVAPPGERRRTAAHSGVDL